MIRWTQIFFLLVLLGAETTRTEAQTITFVECDDSSLSTNLELTCSYTVDPTIPDTTEFTLLPQGCVGSTSPTTVTISAETATSVTIEVDSAAASAGSDVVFCIEYGVGTGGPTVFDQQDVTISFEVDGSFTTSTDVSQVSVGDNEFTAQFDVSSFVCDSNGDAVTADFTLSVGETLFICVIPSQPDVTNIASIDTLTLTKTNVPSFNAITSGGNLEGLTAVAGAGTNKVNVAMVLDIDFFDTSGFVGVSGSAIVAIDAARELEQESTDFTIFVAVQARDSEDSDCFVLDILCLIIKLLSAIF